MKNISPETLYFACHVRHKTLRTIIYGRRWVCDANDVSTFIKGPECPFWAENRVGHSLLGDMWRFFLHFFCIM